MILSIFLAMGVIPYIEPQTDEVTRIGRLD